MDLLITNARVWDDRPPVDIGIEGERIAAIEPGIDADAGRTIDAGGRAVLPGFVEPHLHLDKALIYRRQPARDGTLEEAIRLTGQLKAEQDRDDVLERSRAVLDMAVAHGTIAVRAHPDVDPIQGLLGVETALTVREEYRDLLDLDVVAFPQEGIVKAPGTTRADGGGAAHGRQRRRRVPVQRAHVGRHEAPHRHGLRARPPLRRAGRHARRLRRRRERPALRGRRLHRRADDRARLRGPRLARARHEPRRLTREEAAPVIERLRDARISIVTLPATDVYLGGRGDERNQRRGVTPVHLLRDSGVNVTFSSNNVRNAFTPFGKADMLQIGNLLAHVAQFGTPHSQAEILRMATYDAARSIGLEDYGLAEGRRADLVVCDSPVVADVLADIPPRLWVVRRGRVTVETRHETTIHRTAPVPGA